MKVLSKKLIVVSIFLTLFCSSYAQTYQFKEFGIEEGLSHPVVYTIGEDINGFIWVGTGEGLCKFDGFNFEVSEADDSLAKGFVSNSYLDNNGILWFGHNSGEITYFDGAQFNLLDTKQSVNSSITGISSDERGNVYIVSQNDGLIKVEESLKIDTFKNAFEGKLIYSIKSIGNNKFFIGTNEGLGLYEFKDSDFVEVYKVKELEYIIVQSINEGLNDGTLWLGTEDAGVYLIKAKGTSYDSYEILNIGEKHNLSYENVQSVLEDQEGFVWISTFGKGIFKLIPEPELNYQYSKVINYSTKNGLANDFIKRVYQDWEGNYWIATYGGGLSLSVDEAFTMHYEDLKEIDGNILSVVETEKFIWLGGTGNIVRVNKETNEYDLVKGLPNENIVSLYCDEEALWIGTERSGIYKLNKDKNRAKSFYKSKNSLGNSINSITGKDDYVYVSTQDGILVFDRDSKKLELYNTSKGLPHNDIKHVFVDSRNTPWVATNSNGIVALDLEENFIIESNANLKFTSITEDSNGDLWAATYGVGVFKFEQDTLYNFSEIAGLKSDYCYSIIADDYGKIWVGHRLGMSSIDVETGAVKAYTTEIGISGDCNSNAVFKNADGEILVGTTHGMILYDGAKEKESEFAPKVNITGVEISDNAVDFYNNIDLPYDIYKLRISFVGLSYKDPNSISYQYKLEGYDLEWSDITDAREAYYPRIEDGSFTFKVKACDFSGNCIEEPVEIEIYVTPPLWKRWWFITIMVIVFLGLVVLFIKYRERKQKALQEYLESELALRTKEVVAQKEELEVKNRDITDSINYAQRIQQSILPSINTINDNFSGAFVYYSPRDIVSGDFYWYDRVNRDKFLIVCADSTGHGVPGAFMSMIGTTLIKDICLRSHVDSPSDVLQSLDKELQSTLNQNVDAERAHDGMDIIVCEIDVNTHYMRFASAMRPLILYKDKELQYVRGTKASIGGDPKEEKKFENVGFQLSKGDIIYMFSDGYPDQFGGPRGKKFKMDRVKNMLADVCEKPMEVQQEHVDDTFEKWRGSLQQVDDVLFMGVRI